MVVEQRHGAPAVRETKLSFEQVAVLSDKGPTLSEQNPPSSWIEPMASWTDCQPTWTISRTSNLPSGEVVNRTLFTVWFLCLPRSISW